MATIKTCGCAKCKRATSEIECRRCGKPVWMPEARDGNLCPTCADRLAAKAEELMKRAKGE